jgi:hypothetical protein
MKTKIISLFVVCCLSGCASLNPSPAESKTEDVYTEDASTGTITYKNPSSYEAVRLLVTGRMTIVKINDDFVYWHAPDTGSLEIVLPNGKYTIVTQSDAGEKIFDKVFFSSYVYDLTSDDDSLPTIKETRKTFAGSSTGSKTAAKSKSSSGSASRSRSSSASGSASGSDADSDSNSGMVWVNGYYRKNGTYVKGHWRKR